MLFIGDALPENYAEKSICAMWYNFRLHAEDEQSETQDLSNSA